MHIKRHSKFSFPTNVNGRTGKLINKEGLIWYTDGSKTNEGTGAGVYHINGAQRRSIASVLGSKTHYSRQKYICHQGMHSAEHGKGLQREVHLYSL